MSPFDQQSVNDNFRRRICVSVFGGTGFLGRRIVKRLIAKGAIVRAVSRRPERVRDLFGDGSDIIAIGADIHDEGTIVPAVSGAHAVVNAVSLYVERGEATFHSVHVEGARRLADLSRRHGVERFIQLSGIGAAAHSPSSYISARGKGEAAAREAFSGAIVVRPAVMFAPDDAFVTNLLTLVRRLPVIPMFGSGRTKLQPVFVEDVAEAISRLAAGAALREPVYEFGGPQIYAYRSLLEEFAKLLSVRRLLLPVPLILWKSAAAVAQLMPGAPLTIAQVQLMERDNVAEIDADLTALDVAATPLMQTVRDMLEAKTRPANSGRPGI